jgi:hypothetical protein
MISESSPINLSINNGTTLFWTGDSVTLVSLIITLVDDSNEREEGINEVHRIVKE